VLYTENNMTDAEMAEALRQGVLVNCGSLDRLERLAAAGATRAAVRFNPDIGAGAHEKICTAGPLTKFGVHHSEVAKVRAIEASSNLRVVGCHMHIGSGFLDAEAFIAACQVILGVARQLPNLAFIDVGGGLGIPYKPGDRQIDLAQVGAAVSRMMEGFCASYGRRIELRLEPGRFLVAESGVLVTTVTSVGEAPRKRVTLSQRWGSRLPRASTISAATRGQIASKRAFSARTRSRSARPNSGSAAGSASRSESRSASRARSPSKPPSTAATAKP
jgi:diaminopimelate decarboxylase